MKNNEIEFVNLYLEQIKYLRQEYVSIQDKFLLNTSISLTALGIMIFNIETSAENHDFFYFYLILPFLYFLIPYNTLKYTIRMIGINGYVKYLEYRINDIMGEKVFSWNTRLVNSGCFGGFSFTTTIAQMPVYIVIFILLLKKYFEAQNKSVYLKEYNCILNIFLGILIIVIVMMLIDALLVQTIIFEKLRSEKNTVGLKIIIKNVIKKKREAWYYYDNNEDCNKSNNINQIKKLESLVTKLDDEHMQKLLNYTCTLISEQNKNGE